MLDWNLCIKVLGAFFPSKTLPIPQVFSRVLTMGVHCQIHGPFKTTWFFSLQKGPPIERGWGGSNFDTHPSRSFKDPLFFSSSVKHNGTIYHPSDLFEQIGNERFQQCPVSRAKKVRLERFFPKIQLSSQGANKSLARNACVFFTF